MRDASGFTLRRLLIVPIGVLCLAGCGNASALDEGFANLDASCARHSRTAENWRPGCATRRNLAATAETPSDLYLARRETPRDAMRRDAVISGYAKSQAQPAREAKAAGVMTGGEKAAP